MEPRTSRPIRLSRMGTIRIAALFVVLACGPGGATHHAGGDAEPQWVLTSPPSPLPEAGRGSLHLPQPFRLPHDLWSAAIPVGDRHPSPLRGGAGGGPQ